MSDSLAGLAGRFLGFAATWEAIMRRELRRVGMRVRDDTVRKFGHYQGEVGPFNAWAQLAPVTIAVKQAAGASADDPLIGHYTRGHRNTVWPAHLRNTIETHVERMTLAVGSRDPLGPIHEFGTTGPHPIPPRPFLRPAAHQNEAYFAARMALAYQEAMRSLHF